jgi:hypothetical protein
MEISFMSNKKYVVIILVLGLLLSIGFVVSQDKYAEELAAKELANKDQAGLAIPELERPIDEAGKVTAFGASGVIAPSPWETTQNQTEFAASENAPAEAMMVPPTTAEELYRAFDSVVSIDSYQIVQSLGGVEHDFIACFWRGQLVARLRFDPEVEGLSGYALKMEGGLIDLAFPPSSFNDVVNTLRGETRIAIGYKELSNNRTWGAIISGPSQIGQ